MRSLACRTDLYIGPADKNMGVVALSLPLYLRIMRRHSEDRSTYDPPLDHVQRAGLMCKLRSLVRDLIGFIRGEARRLSKHDPFDPPVDPRQPNLAAAAVEELGVDRASDVYTPSYAEINRQYAQWPVVPYPLVKVHKLTVADNGKPDAAWVTPPDNRLITPACAAPFSVFSKISHEYLQLIMRRLPSYFPDSTALLAVIKGLVIPAGATLVTGDVTAMYPNVGTGAADISRVLAHCREEYRKLFGSERYFATSVSAECDERTLALVLEHHYINFPDITSVDGVLQRQCSGVAMGTETGPSYSSLYLHATIERDWLRKWQHCMLMYRRFIDDILFIWTASREQLTLAQAEFNSVREKIKVNWVNGNSQSYLDLRLTLTQQPGASTMTLEHTNFSKELNCYQYVPFTSDHTLSARTSFVGGMALRYAVNNSNAAGYNQQLLDAIPRFRARGIPHSTITRQLSGVCYADRKRLLGTTVHQGSTTTAVGGQSKSKQGPAPLLLTLRYNHTWAGAGKTTMRRLKANAERKFSEWLQRAGGERRPVRVITGWSNSASLFRITRRQRRPTFFH